MSIILAADTGTRVNTVAVCSVAAEDASFPVEILAESVVSCGRLHAERLIETVQWILAQAGLTLETVDCLAIGIGPGSFTGVRIGIAAWKGLALGADKPLLGVSSLDALARQLLPASAGAPVTVCPALDARMGEVFGAAYRVTPEGRVPIRPAAACSIESLLADLPAPVLIGGDGASLYRDRIAACRPDAAIAPSWAAAPRAAAFAAEAAAQLHAGASGDPGTVNAIYLRKSQAETARENRANGKAAT